MGLSRLLPSGLREPARRFRLGMRVARTGLADRVAGRARRFAGTIHPGVAAGATPEDSGFPWLAAGFSAPIINPLYQARVFENKMHNLGIVRSRMHGLIVPPGGIVSFWRLVGPPDEAHGFREASAMIDLELTTAMGGGLCQLSGVVFNAGLLAGCTILARHAHSMDVYGDQRYIPLGRDATVVWGWKDVRFANPFDQPLLLTIELRPDLAAARLHSTVPLVKSVGIEVEESALIEPSERIETDPNLPGDAREVVFAGYTGRTTVTRRIVTGLDGTRREELIGSDVYRMRPRIVRTGAAR